MRVATLIDVRWWNACAYYAVELSRALHAAGVEVTLGGTPGSPALERAAALGLDVWPLAQAADVPWWQGLASLRSFAQRLAAFDVVNVHRAETHFWVALARAGRRPPPVVVRTRGDVRLPRAHRLAQRLHERWTDGHIVPGQRMAAALGEAFRLHPDRLRVIPAGVDTQRFRPDGVSAEAIRGWRRGHRIPAEAALIVVVARLSPVKGHALLLQALARAELAGNVFVACVGQVEEVSAAALHEEAVRSGLAERLVWVGRVTDVRTAVLAADLVVIPSLDSEAICRVLLEVMALGRAVVGSDAGVIAEWYPGERTRIFRAGDVEDAARALRAALTPWPAARQVLVDEGARLRQATCAGYSAERWACATLAFYEELLQTGGAR